MNKSTYGTGSIRKRERGGKVCWEARYIKDGKQKSITRTTETECKLALEKALTEKDAEERLKRLDLRYSPDITLDEWAGICFEELMTKQKPQTIKVYRRVYSSRLKNALGGKRINEISRRDVQAVVNGMCEKDYSPSSMQGTIAVLSQFYKLAIKEALTEKSPVKGINIKSDKPARAKFALSEEEIRILLQAIPENKDYYKIAVLIMLNTGIRVGEMLAATWLDFAKDFRYLNINKTALGNDGISTTKNEYSERLVPIRPELRSDIIGYRDRVIERGVYNESRAIIFNYHENQKPERRKNHISPESFHVWLNSMCKEIQNEHPEFPMISSHYFRHTFASHALKNGMPPVYIQKICGWSSLSMLNRVYGHTEFEDICASNDKMYEQLGTK